MRAIGKLPKSVLILEFIGMMLLAVALLSVSDSLSLPEPFSRPEVQILMIFLGVLLMLPADAPRDKCTLSCAINGIHAAFHYLKKNYISGCVMTVPTGW